MTTTRSTFGAAMLLALFISAFALASSHTAQAACSGVTVNNNTACDVSLCIATTSGNFCGTILAGNSAFIPFTAAGARVVGVVTICGTTYNFPATAPFCTASFNSSAAIGCCTIACFNPLTCVIDLNTGTAPCPC